MSFLKSFEYALLVTEQGRFTLIEQFSTENRKSSIT